MTAPIPARRKSRFWLYAPFVLLALIAAGWSGFWFYVQGRVTETLDNALAREAQAGRSWTCADRSVGGYPFRIEVRCASLTLTSTRWGDLVSVQTGPSVAVGQIYTPGLAIVQVTGPLQASLPEGRKLNLGWKQFEASAALTLSGFERLSLVMAEPNGVLTAPGKADETWRAAQFELHARRNPTRPATDQATDIAVSTKGSVLPGLDALIGNAEPGDLDLQATVTQSVAFRRGFNPDALETWRAAGGLIELTKLATTKGTARIEASGRILLDPAHRVSGQVNAAVAGIERIGGIQVGGLMAGLGGLLGGRQPQAGATPGLVSIPPLVLRDGRLYIGPLRVPGINAVQPLY
ncbi:DUF2125 domain-containing protein [Bosea caraganae]|nr:DUF2125 domain-containing protein [Bosea caraganae]